MDPEAQECVNIDQDITNAIKDSLNLATTDVYEAAQRHVSAVLKKNPYRLSQRSSILRYVTNKWLIKVLMIITVLYNIASAVVKNFRKFDCFSSFIFRLLGLHEMIEVQCISEVITVA